MKVFKKLKSELVSRALWINRSIDLIEDPQVKSDCRQNLATALSTIQSAACIQDLESAIQMIQTYEQILVGIHERHSFSFFQLLLLPVLLFWELLKGVAALFRTVVGLFLLKDSLEMFWKRDSDAVYKAYLGKRLLKK